MEASTDATCRHGKADIVFALDQSGSINYLEWRHFLAFTKNVAGAFRIGRDLTRVGLLKFSNYVNIKFHLDKYDDRQSVMDAIGKLRNSGGNTNIAAALRTARNMLSVSNGARPAVPKILILLTDGSANHEQSNTLPEANLTKSDGIKVSVQ